jgi:succinate dehydrogenase/fumarate reductase flavoprotein subunit
VQLTEVGQLGGHSVARTHRPLKGLTGAAFISGLERAVGAYAGGNLTMLKGVRLTGMEPLDEGWDLHLRRGSNGELLSARVAAVILATGGFASDKTATSLLREVDPTLLGISSTNGDHATGDGIKIARELGAKTVDMDMVQVHPTGFTEVPLGFQDTGAERPLILCAEIVRGAGSVVLEKSGNRVWDELDTRRAVTAALHATNQPNFVIAVPPQAAKQLDAHIEIYKAKGLLHRVNGSEGVAAFVRDRLGGTAEFIAHTFSSVNAGTSTIPRRTRTFLPLDGEYFVGVMQPVLHYTMGGLAVSPDGMVLVHFLTLNG